MELSQKAIKTAMINKSLNVRGLAKASGLAEPTINNILNHQPKCRLDTIGKLATALDVPASDLIKD